MIKTGNVNIPQKNLAGCSNILNISVNTKLLKSHILRGLISEVQLVSAAIPTKICTHRTLQRVQQPLETSLQDS